MKKLFQAVLMAFMLVSVVSCLDDEETENYADVYISSRIIDGDTLYAVEGYIQSNKKMESVELTTPDNEEYQLEDAGIATYFEKGTSESECTSSLPATGQYLFNITYSDGDQMEETATLEDSIIDIVTIDTIMVDETENSVTVNWEKATNATYYMIRIYQEDERIFVSGFISADTCSYSVDENTSYWSGVPVSNENYELEVNSIKLKITSDSYLNYQCLTFSNQVEFNWPE